MMLVTRKEAAQLLGVSVDTIERRLKRGDLRGHKEHRPQGLTWLVEVPEELATASGNGATPPPPAAAPGDAPASLSYSGGHLQVLEELVATLQTQVKADQEELAAKNKQIEQLHVLLQQAQAALPAPKEYRLSWWRFWRR